MHPIPNPPNCQTTTPANPANRSITPPMLDTSTPSNLANPPHIICRDLFKIHQRADLKAATLRGLDPTVAPGELLAITGASGRGKSTPARICPPAHLGPSPNPDAADPVQRPIPNGNSRKRRPHRPTAAPHYPPAPPTGILTPSQPPPSPYAPHGQPTPPPNNNPSKPCGGAPYT